MRYEKIGKILRTLPAALLLTGLMISSAFGVDMEAGETTLTMPGGEDVTMWGYSITGDADYGTSFGDNGPPVIKALAGTALTINLTNNLNVPTSIIIPGQIPTEANALVPTWTDDTTGLRVGDLTKRVRSFTHETAAAATGIYTWGSLLPGTYLIQSGTHPGVQVQMGLYAVLIVDDGGAGTAFSPGGGAPDITYDNEIALLFSEVDPYLHVAVASNIYGTADYQTTMSEGYRVRYFMINGRAYSAGDEPIAAGNINETSMLRFANAGLETRIPVIQGGRLKVVAEDGNLFTPINNQLQQFDQHSVDLMAGKTLDTVFTNPATAGYVAVYDRRLGLTNDALSTGGMLAFLEIGTPTRTLTVAKNGTGTGTVQSISQPGGIDYGTDNTEVYINGTEVTLHATDAAGSGLTGWSVSDGAPTGECTTLGDCVITMDADKTVTATFASYSSVTLVSPNGGENILGSSGYTIRWGAPANAVTFSLGYNLGTGTPWKTIATGVTGKEHLWIIPEIFPNHGDLNVAVIGYDVSGNQVGYDISDSAAQRYSSVLLTPSSTGITMAATATYNITWNSNLVVSGTINRIGLWYQTASGTPWKLITVLGSDTGTYSWTVPSESTALAKVGIVFYDSAGESLYMDVSDNVFTMTP